MDTSKKSTSCIIEHMTDIHKRSVDPEPKPEDRQDNTLRPQHLMDLIGQENVKENLSILITAARAESRVPGSCSVLWSSWIG